jgi:hypothetical protein
MGLRKGIDRGQEGRTDYFGVAVLRSETLTRYFPLSSNLCRLRHPQANANYPVLEVIRAAENATQRPVRRKIVPRRPGEPPILVPIREKLKERWDGPPSAIWVTSSRGRGLWMQKNSKGEQAQLSML